MDKPTKRSMRNYRRYLGTFLSKQVKQHLKEYNPPTYSNTMAYTRAGNYIVLQPDESYYQKFPQADTAIFVNHFHPPYIYLAERLSLQNENNAVMNAGSSLEGSWILNKLNGESIEKLFTEKQPFINFELKNKRANGSTGCNSFSGTITIDGSSIHFPEAMAMTRMMCAGVGEQTFLEALKKVTGWSVEGNVLSLKMGDSLVMQLQKK